MGFCVVTEKKCKACGEIKPVSEFGEEKRVKSGLTARCISCIKDYGRRWHKQWYKSGGAEERKEYYKKNRVEFGHACTVRLRKHRYGVTKEEYDAMYAAQEGLCAICRQPENWKTKYGVVMDLCVDHDHDTGKVRGLLCNRCNLGIKRFERDVEWLKKAIVYLGLRGRKGNG